LLFRRQLLAMYSTGAKGRSGIDLVDSGHYLIICMNDTILESFLDSYDAEDLLAEACLEPTNQPKQPKQPNGCRNFRTLGGKTLILDSLYGLAHFDSSPSRLYRQRGTALGGVEIVELAEEGSGTRPKRHDSLATLRMCGEAAVD